MTTTPVWQSEQFLAHPAQQLYILDFGLFQVHANNRVIGIPGYLIKTHDGRHILVDTGFPPKYAANAEQATLEDGLGSFGRVLSLTEENLPPAQLAKIGLELSDIDFLVMTHSDVDHVGAWGDFPQAPLIISRAERTQPKPRYFDESPIDWPEANYQLIEGDAVLCAGVALLESPGHSVGHLSLLVNLAETGMVLLTGDAISRPAEFEEGFGGAWDETQARHSAERLRAIADETDAFVIYGHDPEQWPTLRKAPAFYQ